MKNTIAIETNDLGYYVGQDGVTEISRFQVKQNGHITYQVIKDGKPLYVTASKWRETSVVGNLEGDV